MLITDSERSKCKRLAKVVFIVLGPWLASLVSSVEHLVLFVYKANENKKGQIRKKNNEGFVIMNWYLILIAFVITNIYLQFWVWCVCLYNSLHIIFVVTILFCHRLKQTKCWSWSIQSDPDPNFFFCSFLFFFCISC